MDPQAAVTTSQMWGATLVAALVLTSLSVPAWRRVRPPTPRKLPTMLLLLGVVWFGSLYTWAAWTFWGNCYGNVLPPVARWLATVVGVVYGAMGWLFWWVASRTSPRRPLPVFLVLAALQSLPGHLHGIYGRGLLEGCAPVRGISPSAALVFGLFEFAVYWAVVLLVAYAVARRWCGEGAADAPR